MEEPQQLLSRRAEIEKTALTGSQLPRGQFIFSFSLVTMLFFLWGLSYGLIDSLNAHVQTVFNLSIAQSTAFQAAYFGSYLVMAPWAGVFMRRFGFKKGIHVGLGLFSLGTIMFWPCAIFKSYPGFIVCTFVAASGLSWLEVAANTYITVLAPKPGSAPFLLSFAQAFNGLATVIGPLIASKAFYSVGVSLGGVQYTYLGVSMLGVLINLGFWVAPLPEVRQAVSVETEKRIQGSFWTQWHTTIGAFCQFLYVGAQVACAALSINYIISQPIPGHPEGISKATAANMYAGLQASFTLGRFLTAPLLKSCDPCLVLGIYGVMTCVFVAVSGTVGGIAGIVSLYFLFFFESVQYPTIYAIATSGLGSYAKIGGSFVAAGVSGGAWYPAALASFADRKDIAHAHTRAYLLAMFGFVAVSAYGFGMFIDQGKRRGHYTWRNLNDLGNLPARGELPAQATASGHWVTEAGQSSVEETDSKELKV
ncbi:MFS general substrate transporter [Tilletiaria anomala UBC 951]|uniref:MFS general substrate transporter n=1 Tax=Tilletiaria anomala (strain ATCC 24038 / CBS 436.72 / UBC 951) TaxID=1037660 RepID=A0A066VM54_TILAU|nr:MFS general substrate transporter [Tilletiaria anomala UBC 951]KDN39680.1 MFS general substrate transporter [Tilletiaria anomala UBC 951]